MRPRYLVAAAMTLPAVGLGAEVTTLTVRVPEVQKAHRFIQQVYALHEQLIAQREVRTRETIGGYRDQPEYYREVQYIDAASGRLISKIQWEREHPDRIHAIEVYRYDEHGRVSRDYSGWYLPGRYGAPRDTWITLHAHNGELHAWRQFDALDNPTYEYCEGRYQGKPVRIDLDEFQVIRGRRDPNGVMRSPEYQACFAGLPVSSAGQYLTPQ